MADIIIILQCLSQCLDKTTLRQLSYIVPAMLAMTGRVTMLGISRWTEKGGSYRTIQRFFNSPIVWAKANWFFIRHHLLDRQDTVLIGGDESVVTKSGKKTYGLDRFFSSLYGKPVPGLSFFSLSLISVKERSSYPVMMEQVVKEKEEKPDKKNSGKKQVKKRGRPKGSKNKNRREVELTPYLLHIQTMLKSLLVLLGIDLNPVYCVMDGAFGNNNALQMVRQCSLHLISKLRCDAALYFPYQGPQKKRGANKKYGDKLTYDHIPDTYLKETTIVEGIQTNIYQMQMWHKLFPDLLNIVIIVKLNLKTQARAHVVLFSSDLELA
jgi:putative transposase